MSIQEILFHSQNKKYPDIVTKQGEIQNIVPTTTDDGVEIFKFIRPNLSGNIDPNTGNAFGEVSAVLKSDIEEYSQKNFGHSLPERIAPHEFSGTEVRGLIQQMDAPSGAIDPIYTSRPNGININHGWKIHADFVTDMTREQGLATIGRGDDYSIVDQKLAGQFDERLSKLGINSEDFYKFYKTMGMNGSYANPNDVISMAETFDRNNIKYKMGIAKYGEGRHVTAYPQNIVDRDKIIKDLEDTMGTRLVDQNDAAYRQPLSSTGVKNHPLSRGVSGRFTTDYLDVDPTTGKVDFSRASSSGAVPEEYKISGTINPEEINKINKVTQEMPEMAELLHGPDGYVSPYKTIEQIAEERSTGKIPDSYIAGGFKPAEGTYHGPLPGINKPGQIPGTVPQVSPVTPQAAIVTPQPVSAPNVADANANKAIPLADEYDTGATSAKVASGQPITTPPPTAPPKAPPPGTAPPKTPPPKGPSGLGTPTNVKTQPGAHGGGGRPPAPPRPPGPPPPPPGPPSPPPGPPTTSPTGPTAKIVNNTQNSNLTAREALRGIGEDIKAARKPGQRLLSADGSKAMSQAVTRGIKGSRNLKMLAVGSALGLGGYAANRVANRDNPLDLEG
jgi:hypothetical protein